MREYDFKYHKGTSLAVQWLGLHAFTAKGTIPGWETKTLQAAWKSQKEKKSSSAGRVRNKAALSCMGGFTGVSAVRIHLQCRSHRKCRLNPGLGRCPGGGHSDSLQYCCLENPMDRGAWQATVHMVTKSQTWLKQLGTAVWTRKCQHRLIRELEKALGWWL